MWPSFVKQVPKTLDFGTQEQSNDICLLIAGFLTIEANLMASKPLNCLQKKRTKH
jgi:hypothetical protein